MVAADGGVYDRFLFFGGGGMNTPLFYKKDKKRERE